MKYLWLEIIELAFVAGLSSFKSLNNKARKQNWPHIKQQRAYGSPIHLYPLSGLPDDLQIAWAMWDQEKVTQAVEKERSKPGGGKSNRIPLGIGTNLAQRALSLPIRTTYFQTLTKTDLLNGIQKRIYDGYSRGLCPAAREILLERFPQLATIAPEAENILVAEEASTWGQTHLEDQFVYVPHYKIEAAAGFGSIIDSEQIINYLAFHKDWIRNRLRVSLEGLALINVIGDSMEPTLRHNDLILIDMAQRTIKDGLLYVLRIENNLIVKRLERLLDGTIKLRSDNAIYSDQLLNPKNEDEHPQIVGRVIWFGREI